LEAPDLLLINQLSDVYQHAGRGRPCLPNHFLLLLGALIVGTGYYPEYQRPQSFDGCILPARQSSGSGPVYFKM
jgi:hypothetical protein